MEGWEGAKGHWSRMLEIKKYTFLHNPSDVRFVLRQSQLSSHVSMQTPLSFHVFRYTAHLKGLKPLQLK